MATAPHNTAAKSPSGNGDRPELAANLPLANNSFINRMAIRPKNRPLASNVGTSGKVQEEQHQFEKLAGRQTWHWKTMRM